MAIRDRNLRLNGKTLPRGENLKTGRGWRLLTPGGKRHKASLLKTFNVGADRLAIFHLVDLRGKED
ncbi:MAG TPA: hypothetical protein VHR84_18175 [Terriglobales bacterium]|jgi:hypothetical protein|nr:hypothetical protein [Terriglobales bacterium]